MTLQNIFKSRRFICNSTKKLLLIAGLLISANLFAQDDFSLYLKRNSLSQISDFSFLPPTVNKNMLAQLPEIKWDNNPTNYFIFPMQGKIYAIRDGFFDVLVWKDSTWKNLYKGHYSGYNFGAKIFHRHDTIYSLGGYGYWKLQSNLLRFDTSKGGWEMVPAVNEPHDYGSYCTGIKGDTLFSLFGERRRENSGFRAHAKTGFYLNLRTLKWKKVYYQKQTGPGSYLPISNWYIDLKDYLVFEQARGMQLGIYIINKNNFTLSYWDRNEYSMNLSPFVFVKGDALIYQQKQTGLVVLNFDKITGGVTFLGKIQWHRPIVKYVLDAGLLLIIALILWFWIWKYKNPRQGKINGEAEKDLIENLTDKILKLKGEVLDTAKIDQLLEIDHLPYETRRSKRAALINEINARYKRTKGTNLIARRKYEADKRYIQYVIG